MENLSGPRTGHLPTLRNQPLHAWILGPGGANDEVVRGDVFEDLGSGRDAKSHAGLTKNSELRSLFQTPFFPDQETFSAVSVQE